VPLLETCVGLCGLRQRIDGRDRHAQLGLGDGACQCIQQLRHEVDILGGHGYVLGVKPILVGVHAVPYVETERETPRPDH
jgi:hypothetical protein